VIHRDIKPGNIMLEDSVERVRITDFGLAYAAMDDSELTSVGETVGTPAYMSPEQVAGSTIDARSDLFNLGCVMYAMIAGSSPFRAGHSLRVARKITDHTPKPLHELDSKTPRFLSDIVARLLEKAPENRYRSAAEVAQVLLTRLATINQATSDEVQSLIRADADPSKQKRRKPILAIAAAVALLMAAGLVTTSHLRRSGYWTTRPTSETTRPVTTHPLDVGGEPALPVRGNESDRKAAEWALGIGGSVTISVGGQESQEVTDLSELTEANFAVKEIDLTGRDGVTDSQLKNLEGLVHLERLQLRDTSVLGEGLHHVERLTNLVYLGLGGLNLSDSDLEPLAGLTKLERLNLMNTAVSGTGLQHVAAMKLEGLYLNGTQLTDEGLEHLTGQPNLQLLELNDTLVTDTGLEFLKERKSLLELHLSRTRITDEGLEHLHGLVNLRVLVLSGTSVNEIRVQELRAAIPGCQIVR